MKKALTLALGTAFILGSAASALATHGDIPAETSVVAGKNAKITMDGALRMRGAMQKETTKDKKNSASYDGRVRLGVKAALSDAASGYIQLETGDSSGDGYTWGAGTSGGLHSGGSKQADGKTDLSILQAWINYKPGAFGVKVGHMPLMLGNKVFFDHTGSGDDAIQGYMANDKTVAALLLIKFEEGSSADNGDDINGYVGVFNQKLGGGMVFDANLTHLRKSDSGMAATNLGVDFSGKFGPASVSADVEYQFGDWSQADSITGTVDSKAKGYAVRLTGNMAAGPATVGMTVGYGSGDDDATDTDNGTFVNFLTDTAYDVTIAGYRTAIPYTSINGTAYTLNTQKNTGISNLTLVQVNGKLKTTCPITKKDLSLVAKISYMKLNEVPTNADDSLGTELDLNAVWKLSNGLSYKVETAYLLAGDAWKTSAADDPDNAWFLRNGLELKF